MFVSVCNAAELSGVGVCGLRTIGGFAGVAGMGDREDRTDGLGGIKGRLWWEESEVSGEVILLGSL